MPVADVDYRNGLWTTEDCVSSISFLYESLWQGNSAMDCQVLQSALCFRCHYHDKVYQVIFENVLSY